MGARIQQLKRPKFLSWAVFPLGFDEAVWPKIGERRFSVPHFWCFFTIFALKITFSCPRGLWMLPLCISTWILSPWLNEQSPHLKMFFLECSDFLCWTKSRLDLKVFRHKTHCICLGGIHKPHGQLGVKKCLKMTRSTTLKMRKMG